MVALVVALPGMCNKPPFILLEGYLELTHVLYGRGTLQSEMPSRVKGKALQHTPMGHKPVPKLMREVRM